MPPGPGEGEAGVSRTSALHTHSTLTAPEMGFCGKKKKKDQHLQPRGSWLRSLIHQPCLLASEAGGRDAAGLAAGTVSLGTTLNSILCPEKLSLLLRRLEASRSHACSWVSPLRTEGPGGRFSPVVSVGREVRDLQHLGIRLVLLLAEGDPLLLVPDGSNLQDGGPGTRWTIWG